ncbi:hypothetical protein HY375_02410, partial [Candidatus Berkelbacteria bacterium]|nr:hypothetical protein [Candidatus Berkelbacteria bacterium]
RHAVNFEGNYLFRTLYARPSDEPIAYPPMPHAIFSSPQVGSVGPTEEALIERGVDYVVGKNSYADSAMGMALRSEFGFAKLLFERRSRKLLAAHIVGDDAATLVHQLIYALTFDATRENLLEMIYIHPALPEVIRNAAINADFSKPSPQGGPSDWSPVKAHTT